MAGRSGTGFDADARAYIAAVETADGQLLETAVGVAINDFITGCKSDGIWSSFTASCILMGARTLSGALVPLVGGTVTNNNFVSGDYSRKNGLKGTFNSNKMLSQACAAGASLNNHSFSVFLTASPFSAGINWLMESQSSAWSGFFQSSASLNGRSANTQFTHSQSVVAGKLIGISRNGSAGYSFRNNGVTDAVTQASLATNSFATVNVFNCVGQVATGNTYCFYHSGTNLDLALLEARVASLRTAIGNAIP